MTLVDEVKSRLTIVDVVSDYIALDNPASRTPKALCPFHEERTPSFSVSVEHDSWRCWGACGIGGDMIEFVIRADGIEFKEALEKLARKAGIDVELRDRDDDDRTKTKSSSLHDVNSIAEQFFSRQLEGSQGEEALAYLVARGIDATAARRRGIGFAPGGANTLSAYLKSVGADAEAALQAGLVVRGNDVGWRDMFANRITIAIRDQRGNIVGFGARAMGDAQPKYLNTHETSIFNKSKLLYGLHWAVDAIRVSRKAIVVEGYMDVIAAQERGFKNVVACMGTAVTSEQMNTLSTVLPDDADSPSSIVLCLDADEAGQAATLRGLNTAITELRQNSAGRTTQRKSSIDVKVASPVVSEHGEPKDPDEAIRNNSTEWLTSIDQADDVMEFVIRTSLRSHDTKSDVGLDAALNEIEPYFDSIPPSTMQDRRLLTKLGDLLDVEIDIMTNLLTTKRTVRQGAANASNNANTQRPRNRNRRLRNANPTVPMSVTKAKWEIDLLACMVQYPYAIDHVSGVFPQFFSDSVRMRVFESLIMDGNVDDCITRFGAEDAAVALINQLRSVALSPTNDSVENQAAIIQIATDCAMRTRIDYHKRTKKKEVQLAKKNGNILHEDDVKSAVDTNRALKQLAKPREAVPNY